MPKKKEKDWVDLIHSFRGSWGAINPVTKIIPNKKKYTRKEKHKRDYSKDE